MAFEQRSPVVLLCCGSFNPVTVGHLKMFEIARSFLEHTGKHIVIGGVFSPVHENYSKTGLLPSTYRAAMCNIAIQKHAWLSVDTWESSQPDWVKTIKVLQHLSNKIKNDYGIPGPYSNHIHYMPAKYPRSAVTLQPNGTLHHMVVNGRIRSSARSGLAMCSPTSDSFEEKNISFKHVPHTETGETFSNLGGNFQKVCCVSPTSFNMQDNMVYGAAYDLRRTKVMLLCGGDLLESFGVPGLWSEDDICSIVSEYGIVCIPRTSENSENDDGKRMRDALDRLQAILCRVQGTIILVHHQSAAKISHITSSKCRRAISEGCLEDIQDLIDPSVLGYIRKHELYQHKT
nr:nicotinamide/nicotinic acid mononucleotide adenylyltransferase 1 [Ciona intestinalis]|eukprot:XP_002121198.3 nicotinamide/nicotinic acid mononucleotide adenylyltransferase 1 [Ciona intestinalis]